MKVICLRTLRAFVIFLGLGLLIAIPSCDAIGETFATPTPIPEYLTDRSLLTDDPCGPPCWYGLRPDFSNQAEVIEVIQGLDFLDPDSYKVYTTGFYDVEAEELKNGIRINVDCLYPEGFKCISFILLDDSLKFISVSLNYELSFRQTVNRLGEPDYVAAIPGREPFYCVIELIWTDKQVSIDYYEYASKKAVEFCESIPLGQKVNPNLLVENVGYLYTGWIKALPERDTIFPWPGFAEPE